MNIKQHIPNAITCLNLTSGCIAIIMAFNGYFQAAMLWILAAAIFDFFDGFAARLLNAYSAIGKELDSLADVVSFGVAPGIMLFMLLSQYFSLTDDNSLTRFIPFVALIIPVFSALRLAKFNIDTRQAQSFLGLPVPANALFWVSTIYGLDSLIHQYAPYSVIFCIVMVFVTSLLLVSEIPMFSLKIKSLDWRKNKIQIVFLALSLIVIVILKVPGFAVCIVLYVLLSIFNKSK